MTGDKPSLRRGFLDRLRAMPAAAKVRESADIRRRILAWEPFAAARTVLAFCPLPTEPDLLPLLDEPAVAGKRILFPLTHPDGSLTCHAATSAADFRAVRGRLREPDPDRHPQVDPVEIDAALIPGLAFAPDGCRLGRGGGFYDRFLATLRPGTPVAGIAFACQIADRLPCEPHDVRVPPLVSG